MKYGIFPGTAMDGLVYFERDLLNAKQMSIAALKGCICECFWGVFLYIYELYAIFGHPAIQKKLV